ncbi:hypothetical protein GCM10010841_21300 [Deinococcus aerophilus]|uniref:Uncharacterized protein n=1 Tax=Deinococcus aerophilus TaxID=522488 RepID=A0ABQ2GUQ7_9DEIO|nr:hypothetical protein GCM10010841_21300 [Deinococcus aerophilus]
MQFLARLHKAAGQGPGAGVGQFAALDEQGAQLAAVHGKRRHIHRQTNLGGLRRQGEAGHAGDARVSVLGTSRISV